MDTNIFIYFLQDQAPFAPLVRPVFGLLDSGSLPGVTSVLTVLELLVKPLREGRRDLPESYRDALFNAAHLDILPIDRVIAEEGARIRAKHSFKVPDALQLATALRARADAFVTNDIRLQQFGELPTIVIGDFLPIAS